jgi:UDP-N-acetylglucosamine kinase
MSDRQEYRLSEAENEKIFQNDVKPYLLATASLGLSRSEEPTMVIVGGQPGAGKSRSIDSVRLDLERSGGVVEIAADDLRKFHDELMQKNDRTAADFTHADASAWAEKAERFAREQKFNVLIEGTLKTPENAAAKLAEYREAGYFVEARVIAVHERTSWQGVVGRYEQQKEDAGVGRMTPKPVHDAAVAGVLASMEKIETEKLADRVRIDRRGAEQIYSNTLNANGNWERHPAARLHIEVERNKPLTAQQWDAHVAGLDKIDALQQRHGRNATADEMDMVRQLRTAAALERDRAAVRERDVAAATSFAQEKPEVALAKHPRLAGAYATLQAIEAHARDNGLNDQAVQVVQARARENIVKNVETGNYPEVKVRERVEVQATREKEQER